MVRVVFRDDEAHPKPDVTRDTIHERVFTLFGKLTEDHPLNGYDVDWHKFEDGGLVGRDPAEAYPPGCGFSPFFDDRYLSTFTVDLSYMEGTGYTTWFNYGFSDRIEEERRAIDDAVAHDFKKELEPILPILEARGLGPNYHDLYEIGETELADKIDEYANDWLRDNDITFNLSAQVYLPGNSSADHESGTICLYAYFNTESQYHREKYDHVMFKKEMSIDEFLAYDLDVLEKEFITAVG